MREERKFPCGTCLRLQAEPVKRCSECERVQRFEKRIDPTTLFIAIEAEAFFCQKRCDWERRIEYMERNAEGAFGRKCPRCPAFKFLHIRFLKRRSSKDWTFPTTP